MIDTYIAIAILAVTYALIVSERVHMTTAALAGGIAMIGFKVLTTEHAFEAISLEVLFLLAGMMMIANTLASTGVFQWMAIRTVKVAHGSPVRVLLILCVITAVASTFLDNVTTVVMLAPVTLVVARTLEVRAAPMLIAEALASNIGGTATLIGDPPNILIATHANIDFPTFLFNVGPVAVISLAVFLLFVPFMLRGQGEVSSEIRERVAGMDDSQLITDPRLLRTSLIVLGFVVVGFLLQGWLGYEPAGVALMGGAALLLVTRQDPHEYLREIEWSTLFFFIGLFIVVGGLEQVGVLEELGQRAADLTGDSTAAAAMLILWMSAILSGIIDNIPYTATMLPIVDEMTKGLDESREPSVLWWALAIGADMGGNLTVIAASANVLVANLAARAGTKISFWEFFRYGSVTTLGTMIIATVYIWLRYLAF